eukprot:g20470.t1
MLVSPEELDLSDASSTTKVPDTAVVLYSLLNRLADSEAPKGSKGRNVSDGLLKALDNKGQELENEEDDGGDSVGHFATRIEADYDDIAEWEKRLLKLKHWPNFFFHQLTVPPKTLERLPFTWAFRWVAQAATELLLLREAKDARRLATDIVQLGLSYLTACCKAGLRTAQDAKLTQTQSMFSLLQPHAHLKPIRNNYDEFAASSLAYLFWTGQNEKRYMLLGEVYPIEAYVPWLHIGSIRTVKWLQKTRYLGQRWDAMVQIFQDSWNIEQDLKNPDRRMATDNNIGHLKRTLYQLDTAEQERSKWQDELARNKSSQAQALLGQWQRMVQLEDSRLKVRTELKVDESIRKKEAEESQAQKNQERQVTIQDINEKVENTILKLKRLIIYTQRPVAARSSLHPGRRKPSLANFTEDGFDQLKRVLEEIHRRGHPKMFHFESVGYSGRLKELDCQPPEELDLLHAHGVDAAHRWCDFPAQKSHCKQLLLDLDLPLSLAQVLDRPSGLNTSSHPEDNLLLMLPELSEELLQGLGLPPGLGGWIQLSWVRGGLRRSQRSSLRYYLTAGGTTTFYRESKDGRSKSKR